MTRESFYTRWMRVFANGIPKKNIDQYVKATGNYIWHIFSWKLLNEDRYFLGNEAKDAYDQIDKNGAMYIKWFDEKHTRVLTEDLYTANALEDFVEVYVVGQDFQWTYIKTHESTCGPYFMKCN